MIFMKILILMLLFLAPSSFSQENPLPEDGPKVHINHFRVPEFYRTFPGYQIYFAPKSRITDIFPNIDPESFKEFNITTFCRTNAQKHLFSPENLPCDTCILIILTLLFKQREHHMTAHALYQGIKQVVTSDLAHLLGYDVQTFVPIKKQLEYRTKQ